MGYSTNDDSITDIHIISGFLFWGISVIMGILSGGYSINDDLGISSVVLVIIMMIYIYMMYCTSTGDISNEHL